MPHRKRPITVFLPTMHGGGAERAMIVFCRELVKLGYAVDLVVAKTEGPLHEIVPPEVSLFDLKSSRTVLALPRLVSYLKRRKPQAVYATIVNANVVAAAAGRISGEGMPVIIRESNAPISSRKETAARWITHKCVPLVYQFASGIIAVSQGVAEELQEIAPSISHKIKVIPTPVISQETVEQGEAAVKHPWFVDREKPIILSAARLEAHKGFITLARAFAKVRERVDARLVILGDGSERERIRRELETLGVAEHASLLGFVQNPFAYMSKATAFALTSEHEGLPNVLVQAMAFGLPIVATDCKSGPAEVLCSGRFGTLVKVGDVDAIAQGLVRAVSLPRQREAMEYARVRYGARSAAEAYLTMAGLAA